MKLLRERAREVRRLYYEIVEPLFSYPRHKESLASLLGPQTCYEECLSAQELSEALESRHVCVLGPLPSRPEGCEVYGAPEGGLGRALELGVRLTYVTGDMDAEEGLASLALLTVPFLLIHLHGDNRERVLLFSSLLRRRGVLYTSQVDAVGCVLPLGGFTDGDRAVIAAMLMGAEAVKAYGYDFSAPFRGRKPEAAMRDKGLKLLAAREILFRSAVLLGYSVEEGTHMTFLRRR
ncbi:MAG: hypothetical protein N3F67_01420 [Acidilobaceae archaeon]|nr:hypothetical protein [Acidilobaceae archaeon]